MLRANHRVVLYYDLAMMPYPSDAPAIPLDQLVPHLAKRCESNAAFQVVDNERRVIRLSDIRTLKTSNKTPAVALLFCLGDREKAEPGFTHLVTGEVRIVKRKKDEAPGLSVHAVVSLVPTKKDGHVYRMVCEDVNGFGKTLLQTFLRNQFKEICDELGYFFEREGAREVKMRPMVELTGHASEPLKNSLKDGRLLYVELVDYVDEDFGFDEAKYIKTARRDMKLSIAHELPQGDGLTFLEKVKLYAHRKGYEKMRVRWRDDDLEKPQSAQLDTARKDAGEALFVKSAEVSLDQPLPDISAEMSDELIKKIQDLVE